MIVQNDRWTILPKRCGFRRNWDILLMRRRYFYPLDFLRFSGIVYNKFLCWDRIISWYISALLPDVSGNRGRSFQWILEEVRAIGMRNCNISRPLCSLAAPENGHLTFPLLLFRYRKREFFGRGERIKIASWIPRSIILRILLFESANRFLVSDTVPIPRLSLSGWVPFHLLWCAGRILSFSSHLPVGEFSFDLIGPVCSTAVPIGSIAAIHFFVSIKIAVISFSWNNCIYRCMYSKTIGRPQWMKWVMNGISPSHILFLYWLFQHAVFLHYTSSEFLSSPRVSCVWSCCRSG